MGDFWPLSGCEACGAQEVFDLGTGFIGADYLFFRHSFYTGQPASERQGKIYKVAPFIQGMTRKM